MDDRTLALCELSNDLLYHKIPPEKIPYYVDQSLLAGETAAADYAGRDILRLYEENSIRIEYYEKCSERFGVTLRGQTTMSKSECKVELFRASVNELASHSYFHGEKLLDYQMALHVHLAHEFFHFLEYKSGQFVSAKLDKIPSLTLPFFTRYAHISRCSEIAAHAFAKNFLGLPVLPNFYDYLYLINNKKMTQKSFDDLYDNKCKILSAL